MSELRYTDAEMVVIQGLIIGQENRRVPPRKRPRVSQILKRIKNLYSDFSDADLEPGVEAYRWSVQQSGKAIGLRAYREHLASLAKR